MRAKHIFEYTWFDHKNRPTTEVIFVLAISKEDAEMVLRRMSLEPIDFVYMGVEKWQE